LKCALPNRQKVQPTNNCKRGDKGETRRAYFEAQKSAFKKSPTLAEPASITSDGHMAKPLENPLEPGAAETDQPPTGKRLALLSLAALGVVYGDIGTSPLYAIRTCFHGTFGVSVTEPNVLGVLSLIFWSLILVISIKYILYIMHAGNKGEGGILALMALIHPDHAAAGKKRWFIVSLETFEREPNANRKVS
jgi:hypothetical protein